MMPLRNSIIAAFSDFGGGCKQEVRIRAAFAHEGHTAPVGTPPASTVTPVASRFSCPSSILSSFLTLVSYPFDPLTIPFGSAV
jgi:hypothetical protein